MRSTRSPPVIVRRHRACSASAGAQGLLGPLQVVALDQGDGVKKLRARIARIAGDQIGGLFARGIVGRRYLRLRHERGAELVNRETALHERARREERRETHDGDRGADRAQAWTQQIGPPQPEQDQSDGDAAQRPAEMRRIVDLQVFQDRGQRQQGGHQHVDCVHLQPGAGRAPGKAPAQHQHAGEQRHPGARGADRHDEIGIERE